jgi:hypothetical protein
MAAVFCACTLLVSCGTKPTPPSYSEMIRLASQAPRVAPVGTAAVRAHLPGVPAFTEDEARAYAVSATVPGGAARNVRVTSVAFMSGAQVVQRLGGASTGMPDEAALCYIEMAGEFAFAGPSGAIATFDKGFHVLDAKTGNRLMSGGLHTR